MMKIEGSIKNIDYDDEWGEIFGDATCPECGYVWNLTLEVEGRKSI